MAKYQSKYFHQILTAWDEAPHNAQSSQSHHPHPPHPTPSRCAGRKTWKTENNRINLVCFEDTKPVWKTLRTTKCPPPTLEGAKPTQTDCTCSPHFTQEYKLYWAFLFSHRFLLTMGFSECEQHKYVWEKFFSVPFWIHFLNIFGTLLNNLRPCSFVKQFLRYRRLQ